MLAATFWAVHEPSNSRVLLEFGLIDKKVKLTTIFFVKGKVVDLNAYRDCREVAHQMLR